MRKVVCTKDRRCVVKPSRRKQKGSGGLVSSSVEYLIPLRSVVKNIVRRRRKHIGKGKVPKKAQSGKGKRKRTKKKGKKSRKRPSA